MENLKGQICQVSHGGRYFSVFLKKSKKQLVLYGGRLALSKKIEYYRFKKGVQSVSTYI